MRGRQRLRDGQSPLEALRLALAEGEEASRLDGSGFGISYALEAQTVLAQFLASRGLDPSLMHPATDVLLARCIALGASGTPPQPQGLFPATPRFVQALARATPPSSSCSSRDTSWTQASIRARRW